MQNPIRLAIAGVGNCASSLVQGITYYRDADPDEVVPGLMHVELGGYHVRDLVPVAAFDVDQAKVGTDLSKAIHAGLNNTVRFAEVDEVGVTVQRGPTFDGLGLYYRELIEESPAEPVDVAAALREAKADDLLRPHAGDGAGQRPRRWLLPLCGAHRRRHIRTRAPKRDMTGSSGGRPRAAMKTSTDPISTNPSEA